MTELASPFPGPGELSIDVAFAGLNYAEVLYGRGLVDVPLPFVPGIEVAGHVRAVGAGVTGFDVGQKVAALTIINSGGYAEVAVADARLTAPLDDRLELAVAACVPSNSTTAILALEQVAGLRAGEAVLVHAAAGGLGSQLGQTAHLLGAGRVVGTVGTSNKLQAARGFGYDDLIVRETLADRARELTAGRGFDVIADPVGGATRHVSVDALAMGGRLIVMGNASGADDVLIPANNLWLAGKGVLGFNLAAFSTVRPEPVGAALRRAVAAVAEDRMRIHVQDVVPLARAAEFHRLLEDGRTVGKVALSVME
jgi:NADPH2:quinone reductase